MKRLLFFTTALLTLLSASADIKVKITNPLKLSRANETIELSWNELTKKEPRITSENVIVTTSKGDEITSQVVYAGKNEPHLLIFQVSLKDKESAEFTIKLGIRANYKAQTYGRYIPERMDDYAWENNIVAFRAYGPALEKELVTNGFDMWCKRTPEMVIDKWYKIDDYHNDKGEGCDCYKVGVTLGCGASSPYINGKLYFSRNYAKWERLDNGPIRTTVKLTYAPFDANGTEVSLVKTISLDANTHFNKVEDLYSGDFKSIDIAAGVAIHQDAEYVSQKDLLVLTEPASDSKSGKDGDISVAVILRGESFMKVAENYVSLKEVKNNKPMLYYFGAGWNKNGVETFEKWLSVTENKSICINNPLRVSFN